MQAGRWLSRATRGPSENLVTFCKGVDVLIHEVVDLRAWRKFAMSERLFQAIVAHHTTPRQAAEIFTRVKPRLAVFSHTPGTAPIVDQTRRSYAVEMGRDLMVIEIGDEIGSTSRRNNPRMGSGGAWQPLRPPARQRSA